MNARELLDVLDSSGYIEFSNAVLSREHYRQNLELLKSALRLLAAAEANDGTTPETDARVNYEIRAGISLGESAIYDIARTLEMERNGLAARVRELERAPSVTPRIGLNGDGTLDEVVGYTGHLEQLDTCHWFVTIGDYAIWLHSKSKITATYEDRGVNGAARGSKP